MTRRADDSRRPQASRLALSMVVVLVAGGLAAGCSANGGSGGLPITDTYLFSGTIPATAPTQDPQVPYSATFEDYAGIVGSPEELILQRVTVSSNVDLSFATVIEVEAQDWFFLQGRYRTIARFVGHLPIGTYAIDLPLREDDLYYYQEPITGDVNLKVRVQGDAPGIPVQLYGDLDVYQW